MQSFHHDFIHLSISGKSVTYLKQLQLFFCAKFAIIESYFSENFEGYFNLSQCDILYLMSEALRGQEFVYMSSDSELIYTNSCPPPRC